MPDQHPFHAQLPQHAQVLRLRAYKLASNWHRAEDLVQATLLKAWASRDSYKPETNLRAWLFTILRNTFFSDLRKYRREVEDAHGDYAGSLFEAPRQEDRIALKELISVVALLPYAQRKAVVMMGAYGYSQGEAAEACHCTIGTIKSRVSRGRASLIRHYSDEPGQHRPETIRLGAMVDLCHPAVEHEKFPYNANTDQKHRLERRANSRKEG